jgi:hypothetical protein
MRLWHTLGRMKRSCSLMNANHRDRNPGNRTFRFKPRITGGAVKNPARIGRLREGEHPRQDRKNLRLLLSAAVFRLIDHIGVQLFCCLLLGEVY